MTVSSTAKVSRPTVTAMEDVQGLPDSRRLAINRVGIKDISHPVRLRDRSGEQHTVATFGMYVNLPHNLKGTHMSRFVEILHAGEEISLQSFGDMLQTVATRLEAGSAYIEMSFPFFVLKTAPKSGVQSMMNYQVTLFGERHGSDNSLWVRVVVPVTSLCPSSKKISEYGAHNQRSHVTIKAKVRGELWIQDLIDIAESEASAELFSVLKRADEKYVTEHAYENPKFVEDMVRDVATRLNADERIAAYVVESENFESIHNHSAYALIERDKDAAG